MKYLILVFSVILLAGCAEIKPMQLPTYYPPDFSKLSRTEIEPLVEGQDYVIDLDNARVCYNLSGQNKITAKVVSEKAAWQIIEMLKQTIGVQGELIKQNNQLIVFIDLQRQYSERGKTYADVKGIISEIIAVILVGIAIAK